MAKRPVVTVLWKQIQVGKEKRDLTSQVPEDTAKLFKLPIQDAKTGGTKFKAKPDSKGRNRLTNPVESQGRGPEYFLATDGTKTTKGNVKWRRVRVPNGVDLGDIADVLSASGKITKVRWPNGEVYVGQSK